MRSTHQKSLEEAYVRISMLHEHHVLNELGAVRYLMCEGHRRWATRKSVGRIAGVAEQERQERPERQGAHETTEAAAEYLMMIRYMRGEGQPVIAARLAERLGFSAATVSAMVTRLSREGLLTVDEQTRHLELTATGQRAAERTFRRHALSEWLLTEVVGLGWAEADEEAHHLQHALSDRVTDKIDELLGYPPTCPHGNPIPRDGRTPDRPPGIRLSEAKAGTQVTVLRVTEEAEEDARLLTFLQEHGIRPGNLFEVEEVAEHLGTMRIRGGVGGADGAPERDTNGPMSQPVTLGLVAAAKLRVLPGKADGALFHHVPERARLAAAGV
jgi:DtxR family Mn-dependent transcriptional regulator